DERSHPDRLVDVRTDAEAGRRGRGGRRRLRALGPQQGGQGQDPPPSEQLSATDSLFVHGSSSTQVPGGLRSPSSRPPGGRPPAEHTRIMSKIGWGSDKVGVDESAEPCVQQRSPPPTWGGIGWGVDERQSNGSPCLR